MIVLVEQVELCSVRMQQQHTKPRSEAHRLTVPAVMVFSYLQLLRKDDADAEAKTVSDL